MRTITRTAEAVIELRRKLGLTQRQFAERLQVSRRTIIRGEQRGLEIPWYSTSEFRCALYQLWGDLEQLAADRARAKRPRSVTSPRGSDTQPAIATKVSPPAGRDTLSGAAIAKVSRRRRT